MKSQGKLTRTYDLNSHSGQEVILAKDHQKLLFMSSCKNLCSLTDYKFVDSNGNRSTEFEVNEKMDIVINTSKPLR